MAAQHFPSLPCRCGIERGDHLGSSRTWKLFDFRAEHGGRLLAREGARVVEAAAQFFRKRFEEERRAADRRDPFPHPNSLAEKGFEATFKRAVVGDRLDQGTQAFKLAIGGGGIKRFEVGKVMEDQAQRNSGAFSNPLGGRLQVSLLQKIEYRIDDRGSGTLAASTPAVDLFVNRQFH